MGETAALGASMVWAVASLLFVRLGATFDPRTLNLLKTAIAAGWLWLTYRVLDGAWWPTMSGANFAWLAASGIVGLAIGDTAIFRALALIGARRTLVVWALVPPTTAALAVPILGEPVTTPLLLGMGLTLAGVLWVVNERPAAGVAAVSAVGLGFAFLSMFCQSAGNILVKLGSSETSALGVSVVRLVVGSAAIAIHVVLVKRVHEVMRLRRPGVLSLMLWATFLGTYLGIWLSTAGLHYAPAAVAATLGSLSPVFVIPLVWAFDGERPSARAVGGALLAVAGVAVLFLYPAAG